MRIQILSKTRVLLIGLTIAQGNPASAQARAGDAAPTDTIPSVPLDTLRVEGRVDDLVRIANTASEGRVGAADLRTRPLSREGELLETVPGLIVTQHSGEGKANQYFVRGFNLDHGTDFQTRVEGMPVNMPTHGHGQGYTDLNFLVPEFVDLLDYRMGVYHAELGDFGSAGGAEFHLTRELDRPFASLTAGENGFYRAVAGGSTRVGPGVLLAAGEGRVYDGPWDAPQELRKFNGLLRYSVDRGASRFSLLGMAYTGRWNATDQIPLRAVESGEIGRFGRIDPSNGGDATRVSLSSGYSRFGPRSSRQVEVYGIFSDLDLFSNFTYFLENDVNGDQFQQRDRRLILGANAREAIEVDALNASHTATLGGEVRADLIGEVGLHRASGRVRTGTVRQEEVDQLTGGLFAEITSRWHPRLRTVLGIRGDGYTFDVSSDRPENSGTRRAGIVSPKVSVVITPATGTELYLSGGFGFHSNDARGATITVDPATGEPAAPVDPLVRSRGAEVGLRISPVAGMRSTLTAWTVELDSELLFVGDAGATEPTDGSRRMGVTWANFYRPVPSLSLDADISFARARLLDVEAGSDRIPGALESVIAAGVTWEPLGGPFGSLRLRRFGEYPLIEDDSVRAEATTLVNAALGYELRSGARIELSALNLFDTKAADVQYLYESRLPGEPAGGVEDVHFHPVEPRQLRLTVDWMF